MKRQQIGTAREALDWIESLELADTDDLDSVSISVDLSSYGKVAVRIHHASDEELARLVASLGPVPLRAQKDDYSPTSWVVWMNGIIEVTVFVEAEYVQMMRDRIVAAGQVAA